MEQNLPAIILVNPQMGENIGAAARAMANFGLSDLRLVNPRDGWPNEAATANASGALDIMPPVQIFNNTADALKDCHIVYATTARPRDMRKKVFTPKQAAQEISGKAQKTAILFGGERAGLDNDDIALAHHIISVPINPDFWSINLAQTVLLVSYELKQANDETPPFVLPTGDSDPATHEQLNELMIRLEQELESHYFFRSPDMRPTMARNIRNIFSRAEMTEQEVRTFHGIISALIGNKEK
ncbi:MAG TPA: RNA methyltransferase [Alphaproteobacteria bacterium]|nr:RNA methyltransferase [Alphaproteobacteria bacterium]